MKSGHTMYRYLKFLDLVIIALCLSACCASLPNSPCHQRGQQTSLDPSNIKLGVPQKSVLKVRGGAHLDGLHPELIRRARLLYERAEKEGI